MEKVCAIVPTYNNERTLAAVINDVLPYVDGVIVVNDGSTDSTADILNNFAGQIEIVSYTPNRGKGHALKCGFERAEALGYGNAITIDSDGQHFASDIPAFLQTAGEKPGTLLVGQRTTEGEMPAKNSFANQFSNFWMFVQTGRKLRDTQNGFRLYPLSAMKGMRPFSPRYEAEYELLVRCIWKGIALEPVPTRVYYAPDGERVSHFRPFRDFLRISLMNTALVFTAILYGYPSMWLHQLSAKKDPS